MAADLQLASPTAPVRLDLGCGANPREGFEGVDKFAADAKHKVDLFKFPWPWADSSVDELHASHFLEHIPADYIEDGRDRLCAFMDEAWRVLKPGGAFTVIVPNARCNRAFQDPTHRRFFVAESFYYFNADWRKANGLQHYLGACDFNFEVNHTMPVEMQALHPEAAQRRFNESWNVIYDWHVRLTAKK